MRCPNCQTLNPPNARFCMECGNRLVVCSNCGTINLPFAKFCIECGTPLGRGQNGRDSSRPYSSENGSATEALPDNDTVPFTGGSYLKPRSIEYKRAETAFEGNRGERVGNGNGRSISGSGQVPQERRVVTVMFAD